MDAKNDVPGDTNARTAEVTAPHAVLEVEDLKRAPEFPQETASSGWWPKTRLHHLRRRGPVAAVDPDKGTILTYTLEGEDAALFTLAMVDPITTPALLTAPSASWWRSHSTQIR